MAGTAGRPTGTAAVSLMDGIGKTSDRKVLLMRRDSVGSISWSGISLDSRYDVPEENTMILFDLEAVLAGGGDAEMMEDCALFLPRAAVSTVFEQVRPIQEELSRIESIVEPMHQLSQLARVFEPLREFEVQIEGLAKVLEPMQNLQSHLRRFTPLEGLDSELTKLSGAFGESLSQLAATLEPAARLGERLKQLAAQFKPAETLRDEFSALALRFEQSAKSLSQ